ncbi:MAG: hypothetical protein P8Y93_06035 [Acidobacteriota bacterium]|jgi:hypothetical protein
MRSYLVLTENGPLLVMTSLSRITESTLLDALHRKGIEKFIAYEVPVDRLHQFYGVPFEVVASDLERGKEMRVLDFDGHHIFNCLSLSDLGQEIQVEH